MKKIRVAVYEALAERDVGESHPVFKPCFRRLFGVCKSFAEAGGLGSGAAGTKSMMAQVARSNVAMVIELEMRAGAGGKGGGSTVTRSRRK